MEEILGPADTRGVPVIEDCADALFTTYRGKTLGLHGRVGCFSFFSNKNITCGEGGALLTDDGALADDLRRLRSHGMTSPTLERHKGRAYSYDVTAAGFNYRLDEIRAALLRAQLRRLPGFLRRRRSLFARYAERLAGTPVRLPFLDARRRAEYDDTAIHLLPALLPPGVDRTAVMARLKEAGIQSSIHYPPIHSFSAYRRPCQELPHTECLARRELSLPFYPAMSDKDVDLVVETLLASLARAASPSPPLPRGCARRRGQASRPERERWPVIDAARTAGRRRPAPAYRSFGAAPLACKRAFDVVVAGLALVLTAPLFLVIAVLIKLDSPGPLFFRQERVGRRRRCFLMWKFRKMYDGLPTQGPSLTQRYDMRLTRMGRILERTKLDELPQLFNVLAGDMSVVGPRPEVPQFVDDSERWDEVLSVKPGLVGPCQLPLPQRVRTLPRGLPDVEAYYAEHILPGKLAVDAAYARRHHLGTDAVLLARSCVRRPVRHRDPPDPGEPLGPDSEHRRPVVARAGGDSGGRPRRRQAARGRHGLVHRRHCSSRQAALPVRVQDPQLAGHVGQRERPAPLLLVRGGLGRPAGGGPLPDRAPGLRRPGPGGRRNDFFGHSRPLQSRLLHAGNPLAAPAGGRPSAPAACLAPPRPAEHGDGAGVAPPLRRMGRPLGGGTGPARRPRRRRAPGVVLFTPFARTGRLGRWFVGEWCKRAMGTVIGSGLLAAVALAVFQSEVERADLVLDAVLYLAFVTVHVAWRSRVLAAGPVAAPASSGGRPTGQERLLLIGGDMELGAYISVLAPFLNHRLAIAGALVPRPGCRTHTVAGVPILGEPADAAQVVQALRVTRVVFVGPGTDDDAPGRLRDHCNLRDEQIHRVEFPWASAASVAPGRGRNVLLTHTL